MTVEHPDVEVQLTGGDSNVFAIIGAVSKGLKRAGLRDEAAKWVNDAMEQKSYDDVIRLAMNTVTVL